MTMNVLKRMFGRSEVRSGYVVSGLWAVNGNQSLSPADHSGLQPQYIYQLRTGGPLVRSVSLAAIGEQDRGRF